MDENIIATLALNKAITFAIIEPFDRTGDTFRHASYSL
jgi:hypothetical protein